MNRVLLCVGNPLKGDDAVGIELGKSIQEKLPHWKVLFGYDVPEDSVFKIRDLHPDMVVIADAAVGLEGEPEFIELSKENEYLFATHNIPLSVLVTFIEEFCSKVLFLALPIKSENALHVKEGLSQEAKHISQKGVEKILQLEKILHNS